MKTRVLILGYWYGSLPKWWSHFVARCQLNSDWGDWLLFGNSVTPGVMGNITTIQMSSIELGRLVLERLGARLDLAKFKDRRKVCDLRPCYAQVFRQFLSGYSHWGYCDLDAVWGRLFYTLSDEILESHDVVSPGLPYSPAGVLSVYKNIDRCVDLFCELGTWRQMLEGVGGNRYWGMDEVPMFPAIVKAGLSFCFNRKWQLADAEKNGVQRLYQDPSGRLFDRHTGLELAVYHFNRRNRWPSKELVCIG